VTRQPSAAGEPLPADDRLRETVVASRTVHKGFYLDVRVDDIVTPDGRRSTRDIVDHPGAVAIVALDDEERVLMVRQFRLAAGRTLLEIPAGTLDRAADGSLEDPDLAARRELEEETGFRARSWQHLGAFWTAPGFATELMHLYLARDLEPAREGRLGPDEDERLELEHLPWQEALAMAERGEVADAKSLVGLLRLARILELGGAASDAPSSGATPEPGPEPVATARWRMSMGRLVWAAMSMMQASRGTQILGWIAIAAGLFTFWNGADPVVWAYPLVFGGLLVTGIFAVPLVWWQARRRPDVVYAENTLTADEHGVRITAPYGGGAWKWSLFKRVRESRGFLVFDMQLGQGMLVPVDAFDPPNLAAFRRLLLDAGFSPDGKLVERT
jgi:ADP-ribose pyrophosphatase